MSDTEQLFVLAGVWVAIAAVIARFIPGWPARIVVFALLVGIPFWELPYGYYNVQKLCREEGKLLVFEKIPPQRNVCVDYPYESAAKQILQFGFDGVEARGKAGDVRRYVEKPSAESREGRLERVTANYCLTSVSNIRLPWRILRHDLLIARATTRQIVARQSGFYWAGMWWQEEASPVLGRGGFCDFQANYAAKALRDGAN